MGLIIDIYRDDYDSELNVFFGKKSLTLVNVEGPFEPTEDRPAAILTEFVGNKVVLPFGKFKAPDATTRKSKPDVGPRSTLRFRAPIPSQGPATTVRGSEWALSPTFGKQ